MKKESIKLKCKKLDPAAALPDKGTDGAACFDIYTWHGEAIDPGESVVFSTGIAFEIPEGYALMVYSRSGHGFKQGLRLANCVGVIDSDYRGELKVKIHNDSQKTYFAHAYERIAQAMLIEVPRIELDVVDELSETERGEGGFGSTGK